MPEKLWKCVFLSLILTEDLAREAGLLHCVEALVMDVNVKVPIPGSFLPKAFNLQALHLILLILKLTSTVASIEDYPLQNPI